MSEEIDMQPVKKGEEFNVVIETLGDKGDGIAKIAKLAIIIPGTKIGDEVKIRITHVSGKFAFAKVVE